MTDSDSSSGDVYSAFDCDMGDNTLDYGWSLRGLTPTFTCTYSTRGEHDGRAWGTDTTHYLISNTSATASVNISSSSWVGNAPDLCQDMSASPSYMKYGKDSLNPPFIDYSNYGSISGHTWITEGYAENESTYSATMIAHASPFPLTLEDTNTLANSNDSIGVVYTFQGFRNFSNSHLSITGVQFCWGIGDTRRPSALMFIHDYGGTTTCQVGLGLSNAGQPRFNIGGSDNYCENWCELMGVAGKDLYDVDAELQTVAINISEAITACGIDPAAFAGINDIAIVENPQQCAGGTGQSELMVSNICLQNITYSNSTDEMPSILSVSPSQNPAYFNQSMSWQVVLSDDAVSPVKTAFDCDDSTPSLDYNWAYRGNPATFACTYNTLGTKTVTAYASDNGHYPENVSLLNIVDVNNPIGEAAGCTGFVAPPCAGNCYFYDNFNYNSNSIMCNGWQSVNMTPVAGMLRVAGLTYGDQLYYRKEGSPITSSSYDGYSVQYDITINNINTGYFQVYDSDMALMSVNLYWSGGQMTVMTDTPPYQRLLGNYSLAAQNHMKADVSFKTGQVTYTWNGNVVSVPVSDAGVKSASKFVFSWYSPTSVDYNVDNFLIALGAANTNVSLSPTTTYKYDSSMFCAMNWSGGTHKVGSTNVTSDLPYLDVRNCEARGYMKTKYLAGLCMVRACGADIGSAIFQWATSNILMAIIVVLVIILIAPLAIRLRNNNK